MEKFQLDEALSYIIEQIGEADKFLAEHKPWQKEELEKKEILAEAVEKIQVIALMLQPFMPITAATISKHFTGQIQAMTVGLFPRIEVTKKD